MMVEKLTRKEFDLWVRNDFCSFLQLCFHSLNPQTKFLPNWYLQVVAAKLEACRLGKYRRLIINLPPRHFKSTAASVSFVAWYLGHNPAGQIICVSYAQDFAEKLARDFRTVMLSDYYRRLFRTRLSGQKQSVQEFVTTAHGFRMATSVGGVLTGRGADLIVIDDPLKPADAVSDVQRKAVNEWYDNTLYSRLNNKQTGSIILIMQRLHQDDLVGHALEQESWEVLSLPAIAEQDEKHVIVTPLGNRVFSRRAGKALHPERESLETLQRIRATLGEQNFASQYQQQPRPTGGGMVKEKWFKRYTPEQLPEQFEQIVQSWDTANKATELSNYSVCTTWGIANRHVYLLHVLRKRLNYPELKRAVLEQASTYRATVVLIEDRASGTQLIQELITEGLHEVKACTPEKEKVLRLNAQTATIDNGFVHIPDDAAWLADYLDELTTFPHSKYNDQADSTSQALAWIKESQFNSGLHNYYRRENACSMYERGESINRIAAHFKTTEAEIRSWLKELIGRAVACGRGCPICGERLGYNVSITKEGGVEYHTECLKKLRSG